MFKTLKRMVVLGGIGLLLAGVNAIDAPEPEAESPSQGSVWVVCKGNGDDVRCSLGHGDSKVGHIEKSEIESLIRKVRNAIAEKLADDDDEAARAERSRG